MVDKSILVGDIKDKIYNIRGFQVMIDRDLADLYGVKTKALNQAVKRNVSRFPEDFMFQLTNYEKDELVTICDRLKNLKYSSQLPYAFTEQGVANLSSILKSNRAIEVNVQIIRAFVAMRRFISSNAQVFQRLDQVERKQLEYDKKFEEVFNAIEDRSIKPSKGIFFEGQVFDAYVFVSDLIRTAKKSIIVIDNYIDESVLILFSKRRKDVSVNVYTKNLNDQLRLDLEKFNSQYEPIMIEEFRSSHDRFMIIDGKEVYHIGASLKDLGKKWFAFSRFDKDAIKIIDKL